MRIIDLSQSNIISCFGHGEQQMRGQSSKLPVRISAVVHEMASTVLSIVEKVCRKYVLRNF